MRNISAAARWKTHAPARQLVYIALIFAVVIGTVLLIAPVFFVRLIFGSVDPAVAESAKTYLIFLQFPFPFLALYNAPCRALSRNGQCTRLLYVSLVMNVINVAANALMIYLLHMGVLGAGIATALSRAVAAIMMLLLIRGRTNVIHLVAFSPYASSRVW